MPASAFSRDIGEDQIQVASENQRVYNMDRHTKNLRRHPLDPSPAVFHGLVSSSLCRPTPLPPDFASLRFAKRVKPAVGRLFSNLIMEKDHTPINNANTENKTKERRPLGVWVLTIYALLYVGIFELRPTTTLNLLRGHTAMYSEADIPVLIVYTFLKISIFIVSIFAWGGSEIGRKSFLFFVLLYFLGDGISNFAWGTRIPNPDDVRSWISYLSDFAFPTVCIWYFNRPSTKEFFRKVEKRVSP